MTAAHDDRARRRRADRAAASAPADAVLSSPSCISMLAVLGVGRGALYAFDRQYAGRILPGVSVGGVDLSGLTPDEARTGLTTRSALTRRGRAVLASGDQRDDDRLRRCRPRRRYRGHGRRGDGGRPLRQRRRANHRWMPGRRSAASSIAAARRVRCSEARSLRPDPMPHAQRSTRRMPTVDLDQGRLRGRRRRSTGRTADRMRPDGAPDDRPRPRSTRPQRDQGRARSSAPVEPDVTTAEAAEATRAPRSGSPSTSRSSRARRTWTIPAATVRSWLSRSARPRTASTSRSSDPTAVDTALGAIAKKVEPKPLNASFKIVRQQGHRGHARQGTAARSTSPRPTTRVERPPRRPSATSGANATVAPALTVDGAGADDRARPRPPPRR